MGIQHVFFTTLDVVVGTQLKHMYFMQHLSLDTLVIVIFELNKVKHEIANSDTLTTSSSYFFDIYHHRFLLILVYSLTIKCKYFCVNKAPLN